VTVPRGIEEALPINARLVFQTNLVLHAETFLATAYLFSAS